MTQVCVDTHILIWGIREYADPGQEGMINRAKFFISECEANGTRMAIPAVVLGEFLTAIDPRMHARVYNILQQSFPILPYDAAASIRFAKLWHERQHSGAIEDLINHHGATRKELKADCMIVATSIAHRVDAIYSHDGKLKKFADNEIQVLEMPQGPIQGQFDNL
ncbi:MAG: PIN domain-containing protein [Candidatus Competibacteraceae bacterium]